MPAELKEPRFESGKPMLIAGLQQTYNWKTRPEISALWQRFVPFIGRIENAVPGFVYGVLLPGDAAGNFDYMAGAEVTGTDRLPPEFTSVSVPEARYAVFTHSGLVSELSQTMDTIWREWLPKSGLRPRRSPTLERYPEKLNPETDRSGIEVWIPVEQSE